MKLIVVRHGETVWNAERRVQGRGHNSPFTKCGLRQIRRIAHKLRKEKIDVVYTSCLSRCIETVEAAIKGKGDVPVILDQRLNQRNWGTLGGLARAEVGQRFPESGYDTHGQTIDPHKKFIFRPPGGETWGEVGERLKEFLREIFKTHSGDQTVVILTHTAISRSLTAVLTGIDLWKVDRPVNRTNIHTFTVEPIGNDAYRIRNPWFTLWYKSSWSHLFQ